MKYIKLTLKSRCGGIHTLKDFFFFFFTFVELKILPNCRHLPLAHSDKQKESKKNHNDKLQLLSGQMAQHTTPAPRYFSTSST